VRLLPVLASRDSGAAAIFTMILSYLVIYIVQVRGKFTFLPWREELKEGDKMVVISLTWSFLITIFC
jgi:hypothetical protein